MLRGWTSDVDCGSPSTVSVAEEPGATILERQLAATDGVLHAYVNPATETADVVYDSAQTDPWVLVRTFEREGYRAGHPDEATRR